MQSDEGGGVVAELLRLCDGHDANDAVGEQVGEPTPHGAFTHAEVPGHLGVGRAAIDLQRLDDASVQVVRNVNSRAPNLKRGETYSVDAHVSTIG